MSTYDAAVNAVIITPAFDHVDHRLELVVKRSGLPWITLLERSDLPRARSVLLERALETGANRIILCDADTVPPLAVLDTLAEARLTPERAIWGLYPLREGDRWSVNPVDPEAAARAIDDDEPSFQILTGGLGLCVIHRESLERVADKLPLIEEPGGSWHPFCVPIVRDGRYYADDGSLCVRLRESGTELWCDPRLRAGHVVRQVVTALRG